MVTDNFNRKSYTMMILLLPIAVMVVIAAMQQNDITGVVFTGFSTLIAVGAFLLYFILSGKWEKMKKTGFLFLLLSLGCTVLFAALFDTMNQIAVFLPFIVACSAILGMDFGILFIGLSLVCSMMIGKLSATFGFWLLITVFLCILSKWLGKELQKLLLVIISAVCVSAVLRLIAMHYSKELQVEIPEFFVQLIGFMIVAHVIVFLWRKYISELDLLEEKPLSYLEMVAMDAEQKDRENMQVIQKAVSQMISDDNKEQLMNQVIDQLGKDVGEIMSLDQVSDKVDEKKAIDWSVFTSENAVLMKRYETDLPKRYAYARRTAMFCSNAAELIHANEAFAEAIAMYSEIGRLVDKNNYVDAGEKLMKEQELPEELIQAALQSVTKEAKPTSKEAVIVMNALNTLSTIRFLKKNQSVFTVDKIVESTFQVRLMKGNLDESGLTVKEYSELKQYFKEGLQSF